MNLVSTMVGMSIMGAASPMLMTIAITPAEASKRATNFGVAETADQALVLADKLDFPILVRPSYVLGGQGMKIVINCPSYQNID
mgnify:CR=1 FL=1